MSMDYIENRLTYKEYGIETLAVISWQELRSKASVISYALAYSNSSGEDVRSLKLDNVNCGFDEALSIRFEQQDKSLILSIDWSKVKLSNNIITLYVIIKGNHNFNWKRCYTMTYKQVTPTATIEENIPTSVLWGSHEPIASLTFVGQGNGYSNWMYKGNNEIFICEGNGFFVSGRNVEKGLFCGKSGYKISIEPLAKVVVQLYYNYGSNCINENKKEEFILFINSEKKTYEINFTPMIPTIECEVIRTTDKYVLGSKKAEIARINVKKKSINQADLQDVHIVTSNEQFTFCKINNNEFIIYINYEKFKSPLKQAETISILVKAKNAKKNKKEIILTPDITTLSNAIQIVAENVLDVYGLPEQSVVLYRGNSCKTLSLDIANKGKLPITHVSVRVDKKMGVKFENNSYRFDFSTILADNKCPLKLFLSAVDQIGKQEITLIVSADYVETIRRKISVESINQSEAKVNIQLCNELGGTYYVGETYKNQKYFSIKFTSVLPDKVNPESVKKINLSSACATDKAGLFDLRIQDQKLLNPGQSIEYPLFMNGKVESEEVACTIVLGEEQKVFKMPFSVKKYYGFDICFVSETELEYPISSGKLKVATIKVDDAVPMEGEFPKKEEKIKLSKGFMYEDDSDQLILTEGTFDVFLDVHEKFGDVENLDQEEKVTLDCTYSSDVPNEKKCIQEIFEILPYCAKPELGLEFVKYGSSEAIPVLSSSTNIGIFQYTLSQTDDRFLEIGDVLFLNKQRIPWGEKGVDVFDIEVNSEYGIVVGAVGNPENIFIKNGTEAKSFKVLLDWAIWKECGRKSGLKFSIEWRNEDRYIAADFCLELKENRIDDIYSLDLGTTGIVMARLRDFETSLLTLRDASDNQIFNIERDALIISSITVLKMDEDAKEKPGIGKIELSPDRKYYFSDKNQVLVPPKFVIGQEHIPYLDLHKSMKINTVKVCDNEIDYSFDEKHENYLTPDKYIGLIYQDIFNRMGEEDKYVRKLIVTYPNTYTPDKIEIVKTILTDRFTSLKDGYIQFVPESDAVVAFYFDKRINSLDEKLNGFNKNKEEKILIYDMGAGTLDLSFVVIRNDAGRIVATIEKKIGIPIAGNYLDYMLFEVFKKKGFVKSELSAEDEKNAKKFISQMKKDFPETPSDEDFVDEAQDDSKFLEKNKDSANKKEDAHESLKKESERIKYSDLNIETYLEICGKLVITTLLGDVKPDTVVFSGRASQFKPLRKVVKETLGDGVEVHELDSDGTVLKTCVALGAIKYTELFDNEQDYRIENRNQYLKLGVVYFAPNEDASKNEVKYVELINPDDGKWADNAECINGTWCRVFHSSRQVNLKLRNKFIYFIQTSLRDEDIIDLYKTQYTNPVGRRDDLKWSFVNELFRVNSSEITDCDLAHVSIEVGVDKENRMTRHIGSRNMSDKKIVENVEDNIFYKRGMWPFEQKLRDNGRN